MNSFCFFSANPTQRKNAVVAADNLTNDRIVHFWNDSSDTRKADQMFHDFEGIHHKETCVVLTVLANKLQNGIKIFDRPRGLPYFNHLGSRGHLYRVLSSLNAPFLSRKIFSSSTWVFSRFMAEHCSFDTLGSHGFFPRLRVRFYSL